MSRKFLFTALLNLIFYQAYAIESDSSEIEDTLTAETVDQPEFTEEEQQYIEWAGAIWDSLDKQTGTIKLDVAGASLNVPEDFYFLNAKDSETVLVDVWGNPPGQNVLGMLFPADLTPFDEGSWGVTVEYEEDGYVSDDDAADIDYGDLLTQMKEDTRVASQERQDAGYGTIELVGWAAPPYYDQQSHKLYWAKEFKFGGDPINTLNYNIRVLGRKGVLVMNFIAGMDQKPIIEENLANVLALADFDHGSQYSDFNPDIDKVATYGIGALVAGKVLAKTGFLAVLLVFLKKFGVIIVAALAGLGKAFLGRKKAQ